MSFEPYEPSEHPGNGNTSQRPAVSGQQRPDRDRKDRLAIHLVMFPRDTQGRWWRCRPILAILRRIASGRCNEKAPRRVVGGLVELLGGKVFVHWGRGMQYRAGQGSYQGL